jgi:Regulator of chromosome condensation (RCC1) repeat
MECCHCLKSATGHDTVVNQKFCGTVCQASYYLHALIGAGTKRGRDAILPDDFIILQEALQAVGGDAELENALERIEEERSEENIEYFKQVATRVIRDLERRFAGVAAIQRGPLELFKDAIAFYLQTEPTDMYRVYVFGKFVTPPPVQLGPTMLLDPVDIVSVSCGYQRTVFLSRDGRVYISRFMGNATPFEIIGLPKVAAISCGGMITGVVTQDGAVYTIDNSAQQRTIPRPQEIAGLPPVSSISCGGNYAGVVARDGRVFTFGNGDRGQLGNRLQENSLVPFEITGLPAALSISCGYSHTAIVTQDGRVYTFGRNFAGQCGNGAKYGPDILEPFEIPNLPFVISSSCGYAHTGLVTREGRVYTFGDNTFGKLGQEDELQALALRSEATFISCGMDHTAIVTRDGTLYTFGLSNDGRLGREIVAENARRPEPVPNLPPVVLVSCGFSHTAVITKTIIPKFPLNL